MLGSKKRDYKTEHDRTTRKLRVHFNRMTELLKAQGLTLDNAPQEAVDAVSKQAYQEMRDGTLHP